MNFIKSNIWEIERSPLLSYLGALLSALHFFTYFYWKQTSPFLLNPSQPPILCWDFFPHCTSLPQFSLGLVHGLFFTYSLLALVSFCMFMFRRFFATAWFLLFLVTTIKYTVYFFDASLASDIHGLLLFLGIGYLFVPNKSQLVRFTVLMYYLVSGYNDLSPDHLSGFTMMKHYPLPLKGLEWMTAIGVLIKWTLPFLFFTPFGHRLALSISILSAFHIFHFYFQKDFESLALGLFLIYFVADFFERSRLEREKYYQSYALPEPSKLWWPLYLSIYLYVQSPWMIPEIPLDMLKFSRGSSVAECRQITFARYSHRLEQLTQIVPEKIDDKLKCQKQVAYNSVHRLCANLKENAEFQSLSTFFLVRGIGDKSYSLTLKEENICKD